MGYARDDDQIKKRKIVNPFIIFLNATNRGLLMPAYTNIICLKFAHLK